MVVQPLPRFADNQPDRGASCGRNDNYGCVKRARGAIIFSCFRVGDGWQILKATQSTLVRQPLTVNCTVMAASETNNVPMQVNVFFTY